MCFGGIPVQCPSPSPGSRGTLDICSLPLAVVSLAFLIFSPLTLLPGGGCPLTCFPLSASLPLYLSLSLSFSFCLPLCHRVPAKPIGCGHSLPDQSCADSTAGAFEVFGKTSHVWRLYDKILLMPVFLHLHLCRPALALSSLAKMIFPLLK